MQVYKEDFASIVQFIRAMEARQVNKVFAGTLAECEEYLEGCNGNFAIVCDDEYEVDYIN